MLMISKFLKNTLFNLPCAVKTRNRYINILNEVFAKGISIFKKRKVIQIINEEQPVAIISDNPIPIQTLFRKNIIGIRTEKLKNWKDQSTW